MSLLYSILKPIIRKVMPHAWPVFTFLKEGRDGEREIIDDINSFFSGNGKGTA